MDIKNDGIYIQLAILKRLGFDIDKFSKEELAIEVYSLQFKVAELNNETAKLREIKFDFENYTLRIGDKGSINFKNSKYTLLLFLILLNYWENDTVKPSRISKSKIIAQAESSGETWDRNRLRSLLRHLKEKIATNPEIAQLMTFEVEKDFVVFDLPAEHPKLIADLK